MSVRMNTRENMGDGKFQVLRMNHQVDHAVQVIVFVCRSTWIHIESRNEGNAETMEMDGAKIKHT
jgi:hypothetical protein